MWIFSTMKRRSGMFGIAIIWLASAVTASTVEVYEMPIGDDLYQGENELDTGLVYDKFDDNEAYWKKDMLLFKLMKLLKQASVEDSRYNQSEYDYSGSSWPALDIKKAAEKRWLTTPNGATQDSKGPKPLTKARMQRKWKIKKGKGFPTLCYFKLCSFRSFS